MKTCFNLFLFIFTIYSYASTIPYNLNWAKERIAKELAIYKDRKITKRDIDDFFINNPHLQLVKIEIVNNTVRFDTQEISASCKSDRVFTVINCLSRLAANTVFPDITFLISCEDSFDRYSPVPVFVFSKKKSSKTNICFPDFEAIRGYRKLINQVKEGVEAFPFECKKNLALWRGATTGGHYSLDNWQEYPRSQLVLFSKKHPTLVDAKFSHVAQADSNLLPLFKRQELLGNPLSVYDHLSYKYLINIDGNSSSYSRMFWILLSNSLCLHQTTENEQWYYDAIKPYVHYLPFKKDLSDLKEQIAWAETHPNKVRHIIENAHHFAKDCLFQGSVLSYICDLLWAYADIYDHED